MNNTYQLNRFGKTDACGIVYFTVDEIHKLLLMDININDLYIENNNEINYINSWLFGDNQKSQFKIYDPSLCDETLHQKYKAIWNTPEPWKSTNIEEFLYSCCSTNVERERVKNEMIEFKKHDMLPLLCHLKYIIDTLRENNIFWGIGRGSSCSSYVLYLIGLHKVNALKYDLNYFDFFGE